MRMIAARWWLFFLPSVSAAQSFPVVVYPKGLFRNPLDIPIRLAANFGELRANHYHMGLDIRTAHRENLPVYAAADGWVDRIIVEPYGFGQAIYLRHPGGYYTVYGHVNSFYPALTEYIRNEQYRREQWAVALGLPAGLLPVKKGDLIALSGNRGGSQGPHLHFEIRTAPADVNLNPLLFDLPVPDRVPPTFRRLALYDRSRSIYEQSPPVFVVKRKGNVFTIPALKVGFPDIGFGVNGFDTQTGSVNPNGIYLAELYDDGQPVCAFRMDQISYPGTRGINAHIDYRTWSVTGTYFQLLFRLPGYQKSIYSQRGDGIIHLQDRRPHRIRIVLKDPAGNSSSLETTVTYIPGPRPPATFEGTTAYPGMVTAVDSADGAFSLGERSLYDSVHLTYRITDVSTPGVVSRLHAIGSPLVPVADSVTVRLRPNRPLPPHAPVVMQRFDAEGSEIKSVQWLGDWATASFRYFGNFQLLLDTLPPQIRFPGEAENADLRTAARLTVTVTDNLKNIRGFRATLDGKWLMFSNDKARAFIYDFDERCLPGPHELVVRAEDAAGNAGSATLHFSR